MRSRTKKVLILSIVLLFTLQIAGAAKVAGDRAEAVRHREEVKVLKLKQINDAKVLQLEQQKQQLQQQLDEEKAARIKAEALKASRGKRRRSTVIAAFTAPVKKGCVAGLRFCWTDDPYDALSGCEAGMDPTKNTGNGFYGAFQWALRTWQNLVKPEHGNMKTDVPNNPIYYSYAEQKAVVEQYIPISSWHGQFPTCSRKLGL